LVALEVQGQDRRVYMLFRHRLPTAGVIESVRAKFGKVRDAELATLNAGGQLLGNLTAAQALIRKLSQSESRAVLAKKALKGLKRKRYLNAEALLNHDDKSEPRVCAARHLAQQTRLLRTVARPGTGELVAEKGEASISR
jgi:hypothetical protein